MHDIKFGLALPKVKRDLETRITELGITYTIVIPLSAESHDLFVEEVMPEFVA